MKTARNLLPSFLALLLLAAATDAGATVVKFLSLADHVASSDAIVRVRVAGETSYVSEKDGRPRTDRRVRVLESYKGPFQRGDEFIVRQMRGPVGEGVLRIPGDPELGEGEELVLFLMLGTEAEAQKVTYLTALAQSRYTVVRDLSGAWVKRDFDGLAFAFGDDGRVVEPADEPATKLELLEASIRALVER